MNPEIKFYVDVLRSDECQCGRGKHPKKALCWTCYKALPRDKQQALYNPLGNGFEEAYEDAVQWLEV